MSDVHLGKQADPANLCAAIAEKFPATTLVNGLDLALAAGHPKTVNTVLLGALSKLLNIGRELWLQALKIIVPERLFDFNLKTFDLGCNAK